MPKAQGATDATGISRITDADRTALLESLDAGRLAEIDLDVGSADE